jgi:hypothetical protein
MRYITLTSWQLVVLSLLVSIMVAAIVSINTWYLETRVLPEVHVDGSGQCINVVNFENGHAFNCNDVNVLLRRYRTVAPK